MITKGIIKTGEYFDSVALMIVAKDLNLLDGVIDAAVVMGTKENKAIISVSDLLLDEFSACDDTDLLVAIRAKDQKSLDHAFSQVDLFLEKLKQNDSSFTDYVPRSLDGAVSSLPEANMAIISLAGTYAAKEAYKALERDLHVMLFSDNVSLEDEIILKKMAHEKGLLMMGPDCGTAIINGVPLAFANVVKRGTTGIVAAAGTGLQEVSTLISNLGGGISQGIGTGGRDIKKEVGGIMFLDALQALNEDENTETIVLVSKPPDPEVLEKIGKAVKKISKPVIGIFLGAEKELCEKYGIIYAETLEDASYLAVQKSIKKRSANISSAEVKKLTAKMDKKQRYLRALLSGGTYSYESQILAKDIKGIYSNAVAANSKKLVDSNISQEHTIVDLGEDEFTVGKPHPMIDYSTRNKRILTEAKDPETAVIMLDIVLGYGSNMDPLSEIVPTLKEAQKIAKKDNRHIPIICYVTGTDSDPQNRSKVVAGLEKVGAIIQPSNVQATRLALEIVKEVGR